MNSAAGRVARFGLLVALALVLGWVDRAVPLSALLGTAVPGVRLGLANTVLLYGVYLMNPKSCMLLMLCKVALSGLLFGSLSGLLYSLSGGVLSLAVMLLMRKNPARGALGCALLAAGCGCVMLVRGMPAGLTALSAAAAAAALAAFVLIRRRPEFGVVGTSLSGAVAHHAGQVLAAALVLQTPRLLTAYLPVLAVVGAAVGSVTGWTAERVFRVLRLVPGAEQNRNGNR